jgi:hypothetical protein
MKIVTTPAADAFIAERGGRVVWRSTRAEGSWAHTSGWRRTAGAGQQPANRFTQSSKRPHRFAVQPGDGSRSTTTSAGSSCRTSPLRREGFRNKTKRLEAYWNGWCSPVPMFRRRRIDLRRSPGGSPAPAERHRRIQEFLQEHRAARVSTLAEQLGVSE